MEESSNASYTGPISLSSKGVGYFSIEDIEQDIQIPEQSLNTAMHGDTVTISLLPEMPGQRQEGEVTKIEQRAKSVFIGVVDRKNNTCFVIPDDRRLYRDLYIPSPPDKATDGSKVVVKFIKWDDPKKNPEGEITQVLGVKGEHNVEMNAIILEKGFETEFPQQVKEEADRIRMAHQEITDEELKERRDMRGTTTFTIDPADAKDFDDALSFKTLENGDTEIGIHIADVAYFIKEGSVIDKEARNRATSVYLVDRTIPMLPEALSNDLCSLNPDQDKHAFSAVFVMSPDGEVKDRWFGRTAIRSDMRFTYEKAQQTLDAGEGEFYNELSTLNTLAKTLKKKRASKGAIEFESDEVRFDLDEDGVPIRVYLKERGDTHKLVEEFMLLANREVATFLSKGSTKQDILYRVHEKPDPEKLEELFVFMRALGYDVEVDPHETSPKDINAVLNKVSGKSEESLVTKAALRSMAKAVYSTKNQGHFGLAFNYYTHFTSPIRRYPDLVVHRLLAEKLKHNTISPDKIAALKSIAEHSTEKEIKATEAERESIKLKQVEYMENNVGKTFDAIISGVTEWGIYVEETSTLSNGMVRLNSLGDDFYELDPKKYAIVGKRNGKRYTLGDTVKVKLEEADPEQRQLTFTFVE